MIHLYQVNHNAIKQYEDKHSFFLNGEYIIIKNQVSAQDEQRPVKEELQNKDTVYKRNTTENTKTDTT
jgi:hypothetical protein